MLHSSLCCHKKTLSNNFPLRAACNTFRCAAKSKAASTHLHSSLHSHKACAPEPALGPVLVLCVHQPEAMQPAAQHRNEQCQAYSSDGTVDGHQGEHAVPKACLHQPQNSLVLWGCVQLFCSACSGDRVSCSSARGSSLGCKHCGSTAWHPMLMQGNQMQHRMFWHGSPVQWSWLAECRGPLMFPLGAHLD